MKTILNENGLVTHNTGRASTLEIQATSIKADEIYQGDQNLTVLINNLSSKVNTLFDKVLTLANDVVAIKTQIKDFASYKEVEALETRLDKELKAIEKSSKTQTKASTKEPKEEPAIKQ